MPDNYTDLSVKTITIEPGQVTCRFVLNKKGHSLVFAIKDEKMDLSNPIYQLTTAIVTYINKKYKLGLSEGGNENAAKEQGMEQTRKD